MDQKNYPDFDELNDRVIAESANSPVYQIKTNLDPKNIEEENPYFPKDKTLSAEEKKKFERFFE